MGNSCNRQVGDLTVPREAFPFGAAPQLWRIRTRSPQMPRPAPAWGGLERLPVSLTGRMWVRGAGRSHRGPCQSFGEAGEGQVSVQAWSP